MEKERWNEHRAPLTLKLDRRWISKQAFLSNPKPVRRFVCETIDWLVSERTMNVQARKHTRTQTHRLYRIYTRTVLCEMCIYIYEAFLYFCLCTHAFCVVVNNQKAYTCGIGTRYFGAHRRMKLFSSFFVSRFVSFCTFIRSIPLWFHSVRFVSLADCVLVHVLHLCDTCKHQMCWQSSAAIQSEKWQ